MKLVLITGASSGVGAATAQEFAKNGAQVILVARSHDAIEALAKNIGDRAIAAPCDAADPEQVASMATRIVSDYGTPDVIVHCAGAGQWKTLQDTTPQEAVTMMQAPYFAAFNITHAFLSDMLERGSGVIINVNSPACIIPWPSSVGYTATRAALRGFHQALSQDLVGTSVQTCHVIFGQVNSEYFNNNPGTEGKFPALAKTIPTLSVEYCASKLVTLANRPRHTSIYPFILRIYCAFGVIFPSLTRWLLRL